MAKYKSIVITNAGLSLVAATHSGGSIEFTAIKTGNGVYDGTEALETMPGLKSVRQTFGITGLTREAAVVKVRSSLSNESVTEGYYITEIGLYALDSSTGNEVLYAIVVAETNMADYFTPYAEFPQSMTLELYITAVGLEEGVTFTASIIEGLYVSVQDFEEYRTVTDSHIENTENPHGVTAAQVDLGNVPNVATNDQTPTFTEASANATLTSGEKLSVAFGKIAKAISSLISHLSNKSNPHGVTAAQVGLGSVNNTADSAKSVKYATSAGSATSATSATKATQDGDGNVIATTYLKKSQIANNLTTTTAGMVLDATQGKALNDTIKTINSNLKLKQSKPIVLTAENIDTQMYEGADFRWGYGLINNNGYLSFSIGWITLQFRSYGLSMQQRVGYGNTGWSDWNSV